MSSTDWQASSGPRASSCLGPQQALGVLAKNAKHTLHEEPRGKAMLLQAGTTRKPIGFGGTGGVSEMPAETTQMGTALFKH